MSPTAAAVWMVADANSGCAASNRRALGLPAQVGLLAGTGIPAVAVSQAGQARKLVMFHAVLCSMDSRSASVSVPVRSSSMSRLCVCQPAPGSSDAS